MTQTPFQNSTVEAVFDGFPEDKRSILLTLREMIFSCAGETEAVGTIEETLKWGEPAYLTLKPKSGTTIRLGLSKTGSPALFVHCQTTLISELQSLFPEDFTYGGNRAIYVDELSPESSDKVKLLINRALTYHQK